MLAEKTRSRGLPVLSVEYGAESYRAYGHERMDLWQVCERYTYSLFNILGNVIPDASTWDRVCDRVYWDYLCVPIEKCKWFEHDISNRAARPRNAVSSEKVSLTAL